MNRRLSHTTNTSKPPVANNPVRPMPLRPQSGVVQAMKRKGKARDEDTEPNKKQDTKKTLEDYVTKIFGTSCNDSTQE